MSNTDINEIIQTATRLLIVLIPATLAFRTNFKRR